MTKVDEIYQHSITTVQTTLNVATRYNKIRYSKAAGLYRKYANKVTVKIQLGVTASLVVGDNYIQKLGCIMLCRPKSST